MHTSSHSRPIESALRAQDGWLEVLLMASTRIVAVSEDVAKALQTSRTWSPWWDDKLSVIENASRFAPSDEMRQRGRQRVAFVGRATPQKGWEHFVNLSAHLVDTDLMFAANTCHEHLDPADYPNISLSALLDDEQMAAFLAEADVLVAPYVGCDGLPLAVMEALAVGLPVIGFDSPGVGSLLREHGQTVIEPDFAVLRQTIEHWHAGGLVLRAADTQSVRTWDRAIGEYADMLRRMA